MATGSILGALQVLPDVPASALAGVLGPNPDTPGIPAGGVGLQLEGIFKQTEQAVSVGGEARVIFGPVPANRMWLVQRYVISVTGSPGSVCSIYTDEIATSTLEDGTISGDLDVGEGEPSLIVASGSVLIFHWLGAGAGNTASARLQYAVAAIA